MHFDETYSVPFDNAGMVNHFAMRESFAPQMNQTQEMCSSEHLLFAFSRTDRYLADRQLSHFRNILILPT